MKKGILLSLITLFSLISCNSNEENLYEEDFLAAENTLNSFNTTERGLDESDSLITENKPLTFAVLERGIATIEEISVKDLESYKAFFPVLNKTKKSWVMTANYFYDSMTYAYGTFFALDEACDYLDDYISTSKFKRYKSEIQDPFDFTFYSKSAKYQVTYKGEVYKQVGEKYYLSNQIIDIFPLFMSFLDYYTLWPALLPDGFTTRKNMVLSYQGQSITTDQLYTYCDGNDDSTGNKLANYYVDKRTFSINSVSSDISNCIEIRDEQYDVTYYLSESGQLKYFGTSRYIYSWVAMYHIFNVDTMNVFYTNIDFQEVLKLFE